MNTTALASLRLNRSSLPESKKGFADSLLDQWNRRGYLSDKQWYWIEQLARSATSPQPELAKAEVGDFAGVIALFTEAQKHLKHPKVRLVCNGHPLVLSLAGARSKNPGWVNLTDGGPYGANEWYGRISPAGEWNIANGLNEGKTAAIRELLGALARDAAGTAAEHGKLTGNCCFCNLTLSDERSTDVGYGPICADHFGLPWGGKKN